MKLLVVEDDVTTGAYIARGLREEGQSGRSGGQRASDGLMQATAGSYDVLIVDRMLPEIDGMTLVKTLRGAGNRTPVLFLTSLGSVDDRIERAERGGRRLPRQTLRLRRAVGPGRRAGPAPAGAWSRKRCCARAI